MPEPTMDGNDPLRVELAECAALCRIGEAADVVVHEFSNVLNGILLQTAVLQQKADPTLRAELSAMRDQGRIAIDLMRRLQQYRHGGRPKSYAVDLNRVVRDIRLPSLGAKVLHLDLALDLPPAQATIADIKLLATLLAENAVAATASVGSVWIRTRLEETTIRLQIDDGGPLLDPALLAHLFAPTVCHRDGYNPLELAASQTIARRINATMHAENHAGGVSLIVNLKKAGS